VTQAFICDAIRTPFDRYGGVLCSVHADDLGAIASRALMARNPSADWAVWLRQPGRRKQPQRRAHVIAVGWPATGSTGRNNQPAQEIALIIERV
jgi:acetyl-CoA acetyltransferase